MLIKEAKSLSELEMWSKGHKKKKKRNQEENGNGSVESNQNKDINKIGSK